MLQATTRQGTPFTAGHVGLAITTAIDASAMRLYGAGEGLFRRLPLEAAGGYIFNSSMRQMTACLTTPVSVGLTLSLAVHDPFRQELVYVSPAGNTIPFQEKTSLAY